MRSAIGCDHGAFALKNKVIEHLEKQGHEVRDFGTYSTESCDYPDFAAAAARAVASGECQRGIVLCTTGIGMSITANKIDGIRCNRPNGAFYVFADISSFGLSSVEFCNRLLDEQKVVCIPGSAFGECGEGFIRIAYTCSDDELHEALKRISRFCSELRAA